MLFNFIIVLVSIVVLIISLVLFRKAAGTISPLKLNTISYVLYFQLLTSAFVGSILVVTNSVDHHYMVANVSEPVKFYAWLGVMYSFIVLPLSMIVSNNIFKIKSTIQFHDYIYRPTFDDLGKNDSKIILLLMVVVCSFIIAYIFYYSNSIPLFDLLKGDVLEATLGRIEVRRNFDGIVYIKNILGYMFIPICSYYSYIKYKIRKNNFNLVVFIILTLLSVLILTHDTQKAPVAFYFFGYIIITTLMNGGITFRSFIIIMISSILVIILGYYLTADYQLNQLTNYRSAFWSRTFVSSYGGYLMSLEYFPDKITQPTWQIGLPTIILDAFNLPKTESARLLMQEINPSGVASGTSNIVSSYYLGEAWANYGLIGLILAPVIVGFVVNSLQIFLLKSKKLPMHIAFYAFMTTEWLLISGFVNILFLKQLFYPLVLFLFIKISINFLKRL